MRPGEEGRDEGKKIAVSPVNEKTEKNESMGDTIHYESVHNARRYILYFPRRRHGVIGFSSIIPIDGEARRNARAIFSSKASRD